MQTKTIFASPPAAVTAVPIAAAFVPQVQVLVSAYPTETLVIVGVINFLLRWVTHGRVTLF